MMCARRCRRPEAHADFGIANAIARNDVREALREVGRSLEAGMVAFMILGQLRIAAERLPARGSSRQWRPSFGPTSR